MTATATAIAPEFQFRVVVPMADGDEVWGYFPTSRLASEFTNALFVDRCLKSSVEWFCNGRWWSDWY